VVVSAGAVMEFATAVASKFDSTTLRQRHAHLDLRFKSDTKMCASGVLAEIWGNAPMTQATTAMLQPPRK